MKWIALTFILLTYPLLGTEFLVVDTTTGEYPLGRYLDILEDPGAHLTIQDISDSKSKLSWIKNQQDVPNMGYTKSAYWLRFTIKNTLASQQIFLLELGYPHHDYVDLYFVDQNETLVRKNCGRSYPFSQRDILYRNCVFSIPMDRASYTFYLRSESQASMIMPLTLWRPSTFAEAKIPESFGFSLYYGIMLVMVIYNLFLSLSTGKVNYLYYVLYIGGYALFAAAYNGVGFQFLWPNSTRFSGMSTGFFMSFSMFWGFLFFRSFLNTKANTPVMDKMLFVTDVVSLALATLSFFIPYRYILLGICFVAIFGLSTSFVTGIICLKKGYRPARFYVLAFFVFLFGGVILALRSMGFIPAMFITEFASQIGSAAEVVLLSLALADQIKFEQRMAQQEIEHLNTNLEKKVKEQTYDIMTQKEQLTKANAELKTLDKQKTNFFQNVSHELRTPLTLILNTHQRIQKKLPHDHDVITAQNNSKRLYRLVNQLLDFQRLEATNQQLKLSPINMASFIKVCGDFFCTTTSNKEIQLKLTINGGSITDASAHKIIVNGDIDALEKIVFNFLSNAIKYSAVGGTVELGLTTEVEEKVRIFVRDEGRGIAPQDQKKLFQVFSQIDGSSTREYEGTGLGLALTKELTTKMGGEIGVTSELGKGSCFWVEFPHCKEFKPVLDLLFVDDDSDIRALITSSFAKEKISFKAAGGPGAAREIIAQYQVRVLLTDQYMPQEDGVSLLAFIAKEQPQCARMMLTVHSDQNTLQRAINEGKVQHVFYKPLDVSQVLPEILNSIHNSPVQTVIEVNENFEVKDWLLEKHQPPTELEATVPIHQIDTRKELILVIDDLPDMRDLICDLLREQDYMVIAAVDGIDGLEKAKIHRPSLVIVDWMMPRMSGPDFITNLRGTSAIANLPVILLTAKSDHESKVAGLSVGADAFLGKPFDELELISTTRNMLKLKSGEQAIANSLEDKSILVAMITHDIANPLTVTTTATEMIDTILEEATKPIQENVAKYLEMVKRSCASIAAIISQVKLLESVDNKRQFNFEAVHLPAAFDESFYSVREKIAAKQIVIDKFIDDLTVLGDKSALVHSIINNLLTNAIKFSVNGGKITCKARELDDQTIAMEIYDEGSGIPSEMQKVLFSIGHKTTRPGTAGEQGTGFGLPIAKKLLTKMNGTIAVASPYDLENGTSCSGAKFTITLPKAKSHATGPMTADDGGTARPLKPAA